METLSNNRIFRQCLVLMQLLLITKVYDVLATPLRTESATYSKTAATNRSESSKTSNYFLHQPYGPNTYAFGYQVEDAHTGNVQFRDERRYLNGSIVGSFGYVRPDAHIQVTRYRADADGGYLAHSQSYAPGEQQVDTIWPTKLPDLLRDQHKMQPANNVSWDAKQHLNVSVDEVEDDVAEKLKQQHGLDLFHIDVAQDVLQPAVLDIVNGKTPLKQQPNGSLAFETLQKVVPNELPLVPFELPVEELLTRATTTTTTATTESSVELSKYDKAKSNNAEKAPQITETDSSELLPPRPLVNNVSNSSNWYKQIIEANRREFLEHLPNLNKVNV
ncbi:uncharacterized protein LOC133842283 [Drosophila sulfurigaster albostrigata]|uniref:uncharacterized protein LOC133842283 n=1 Tax=Drosophila sulfurigaster albostrigata TaxID=89887 RepID=UPI002D21DEC8|nr:uncharacterized protein LOC133842283 [Drosophila sulfurigaster albostrigata]